MGGLRVVRHVIPFVLLAACGGGSKKPQKPVVTEVVQPPKPETEADREQKRHALATAIVPEGSSCLPVSLKEENAPRLELAAVGSDAIVCAIDTDASRLLGPVGCWKVDLGTGGLAYQAPAPVPGLNLDVTLDAGCARGYCLPKDAKDAGKVAHIAWNLDGSKVAVLAGEQVHLFDGASKEHSSSFSIRGDKGVTGDPTAVHFVGDAVFVEAGDHVGVFKLDGTAVGPIAGLGGKVEQPASTKHGSFSILDKNRVGVAEKGFETFTVYEIDSGKRSKLVRKVGKPACKPAEIDAFWQDGDKVTDKCKDSMMKQSGHLMGASAVAGAKNFLVLLRNDRLGELAVLDSKTLAEKKAIKLPWCDKADDASAKPGKKAADADEAAPAKAEPADKADKAAPATTRAPAKKAAGKTSDPQEGGE